MGAVNTYNIIEILVIFHNLFVGDIMNKYKKFMYIGIFILLISLVSSAGTYAWFTWISPSNTSVTLSIGNLADVTFTSGPDINITNLAPVYNYTDGVSTTFTVRNTNSTDSLLYKVKLEITSIANELKDESFKYTLLKDNKVVKTGNLKDAVSGNTLILNTSSLDKGSTSSPKTSTFKLYFWIDGNMENNSNMMNKSLIGKIDVGVETNVIVSDNSTPSSGDSTFLNTSIARKNIKTLKYVDNLNIPEGATVVDVSKNNDNTIKMWYNEADANGNYDITIGSNNIIYANPTPYMFKWFTNVTSLDLSNLDTSGITDMTGMFAHTKNLTEIIFGEHFNTSNVKSMYEMFCNTYMLKSIDLSKLDTSNVTNMGYMFYGSGVETLDLSTFDTSNVTAMNWMFASVSKITSLDLSSFNTSNVTNMSNMFARASKVSKLDISSFDTSNVTNFNAMFHSMSGMTTIDLSNIDTSNATNLSAMFASCANLKSIDLSKFDTSNVTDISSMFEYCCELISINLSNFDTSKVTAMGRTFKNTSNLTEIIFGEHFNTSNVTTMFEMFLGSNIKEIDLSNFDTSNVINMDGMFRQCNFSKLDLSNFNTSKLKSAKLMFQRNGNIDVIDLSNADFTNLTTSTGMFEGVPTSVNLKLKDTETNRNFMNTNFSSYHPTYI